MNNGSNVNNPTKAADAGTGFLMNLGYAIAGNGWDMQVTPEERERECQLGITVPIAKNPDGSSITGPSYEYINFDNAKGLRYELAYPAATLDKSKATLTVRARLDDKPTTIPASDWEYVNENDYPPAARRNRVQAKPRLRVHVHGERSGRRRPRFRGNARLRVFPEERGRRRFRDPESAGRQHPEHLLCHLFAAGAVHQRLPDLGLQPGRKRPDGHRRRAELDRRRQHRQHQLPVRANRKDRAQPPESPVPGRRVPVRLSGVEGHLSGRTAGRSQRCTASKTCPEAFEVNSANEYWVKAGSLLHTDTKGNYLPDPENVRFYLMSGVQHGTGELQHRGVCQQFTNGNNAEPALRALLVALDQWVSQRNRPPPSAVPRRSDKTAAMAVPGPVFRPAVVPQDALGWPTIPGVTYSGLITTRYLLDFGPTFATKGIFEIMPPSLDKRPVYPNFVSRVDEDGNEIAGIRLPAVAAPISTTTGWALRRAEFGENEGCEGAGQNSRSKPRRRNATAAGDPRLSLEERYKDHDGYVQAVRRQRRPSRSGACCFPRM